jgi:hypothetical protein
MLGRVVGVTLIAATFCVAWVTPATRSHAARASAVPCTDIIHYTKFPYRTGGYRLVLGSLSVPPAYLRQVVLTHDRPWAYWRKGGLVVRARAAAVTVTVPRAWRGRAAMTWGNRGGPVSSLRIASCAGPTTVGHAYTGGFYLRARAACVPILFMVGARRATVHFGLGRRC